MTSPVVLGMDLSLRSTGAVVLPSTWFPGMMPARLFDVPTLLTGYDLEAPTNRDRIVRMAAVVQDVLDFARLHRVTHTFVEDHAYGLAAKRGVIMGELAGAVKVAFMRDMAMEVVPLNQSRVRSYFLGKLPKKDRAAATHSALRGIGCPWEDSDRGDAFLVSSYGMTELGFPGVTLRDIGDD